MANEEVLTLMQKRLSLYDLPKFEAIVQQNGNPNEVDEAILWRALYLTNSVDFYSLVLPQPDKLLGVYIPIVGRKKYKDKDVFMAAPRIAAASVAFIEERNLYNMHKAWDIVARASMLARENEQKYLVKEGSNPQDVEAKRLHDITSKYEEDEIKTFNNILKTRPEKFKVMEFLYKDSNIARRNRRIDKYLFKKANDKIFTKLQRKLHKLDSEGLKEIHESLAEDRVGVIKDIRNPTIPVFEGKGFVGRRVARIKNTIADSVVGVVLNYGFLETPNIDRKKQEADTMLPDDFLFIEAADKFFGLDSRILKMGEPIIGTPLDLNNILAKDLTAANLMATLGDQGAKVANENIKSSTAKIADRGKRGLRIAAAAISIIMISISIGLIVAFPFTMPVMAACIVVILAAVGSFFYFKRDPISKVVENYKAIRSDISSSIINIVKDPKSRFNMPDATRQYLQDLDPKISKILETHFKERAAKIKEKLRTANVSEKELIEKDLDKLEDDWKIITAENISDRHQFYDLIKIYLREEYENVERPKFIALAQENKRLAERDPQQRNNLFFSEEKTKIDELAKLVEKVTSIDDRKPSGQRL